VARVSCAAAAWFVLRSCCRWLPGPWAALPGLQLFAAWLLQRVQLFAGHLLQRVQLFAQLLPGPRCLDLVPVAAERCLVAAGRPGRAAAAGGCLVAQLLPGRVCVCVPGRSVFVIRWPGSQTLGPRALVRGPWPACLAAWSVATGPRGLQRK
jgi:hypothetical protein